jgi:hypothetical protein
MVAGERGGGIKLWKVSKESFSPVAALKTPDQHA